MNDTLNKIRTRIISKSLPIVFRTGTEPQGLVRLGSAYGGWWVPGSRLGPDSVCYCGGAGTDISFDLALINTFGCSVWAIDPTPKSIDWIHSQRDLDPRFSLVPVGLGGQTNSNQRFYAPENPEHVSHSAKNLQRTHTFFEAPVETIASLMQSLGHDRIDLLKLDIEGAEHETLARMLVDGILPAVICVEYDQPEPLKWAWDTTARLRKAGYKLVKVDQLNLTFVHTEA